MVIEEILRQVDIAKELCSKIGLNWDEILSHVSSEVFGAHVDSSVWWMDLD